MAKKKNNQKSKATKVMVAPSTSKVIMQHGKHETASNAAKPHGDAKLRTTQASNARHLRSAEMGSIKESEMAAVGCLDPFAAFQRQYKTGLPFNPMTPPAYGSGLVLLRELKTSSGLEHRVPSMARLSMSHLGVVPL